jgi:hypothetical protein
MPAKLGEAGRRIMRCDELKCFAVPAVDISKTGGAERSIAFCSPSTVTRLQMVPPKTWNSLGRRRYEADLLLVV